MKRFAIVSLVLVFVLIGSTTQLGAQGFGGYGGAGNYDASDYELEGSWRADGDVPVLLPENALNFITVDGTAEIRVVPEEIRVVLAITSEAETADDCQKKNAEQVAAVLKEWAALEIPDDNIVTDFINVLPRYEWRLIERDGQNVRIQQKEGYRMQSNLHVAVKTEADAMLAINRAFKVGVTDIVTFDYWSSQLDEQKAKARALAVDAAKKKAEVLLTVFDKRPPVINVQEGTAVFFPHALYRTYENVLEEEADYYVQRSIPQVKAYRPKMTFFHGLVSSSDVRPAELAMRPEIAIVSTVRLYYQSPAEKSRVDVTRKSPLFN